MDSQVFEKLSLLKLLSITETLTAGGAEWFALRLSRSLLQEGHDVAVFVLRPDLTDKRITGNFPELPLLHPPLPLVKAAVLADRLMNKVFQRTFWLETLAVRYLRYYMKRQRTDALHSHLIPSDAVTAKANKKAGIKHITTIHGDYIQAIKKNNRRLIAVIKKVVPRLHHIAVISNEQIATLQQFFPDIASRLVKIYNGYPLPSRLPQTPKNETFTFGMIARGIPEKGWKESIEAFSQLSDQRLRLVLAGESAYLKDLEKTVKDPRIVFSGFSDNPLSVIASFDVGLLPSYYASESLPTSVIEYLALGKPVIATDVGEIRLMVQSEIGEAGIVLPFSNGNKLVAGLHDAMMKLSQRTEVYDEAAKAAKEAFKKFSMALCVAAYIALYQSK